MVQRAPSRLPDRAPTIRELLAAEERTVSFEFFPPRTPEGERTLQDTLRTLRALEPSFVSVTYGAGGSTRDRTVELTKWIKRDLGIEAIPGTIDLGGNRASGNGNPLQCQVVTCSAP